MILGSHVKHISRDISTDSSACTNQCTDKTQWLWIHFCMTLMFFFYSVAMHLTEVGLGDVLDLSCTVYDHPHVWPWKGFGITC